MCNCKVKILWQNFTFYSWWNCTKLTSKHLSCHLLANISSWGAFRYSDPTISGSKTQWSAAFRLHPCFICDCCIMMASVSSSLVPGLSMDSDTTNPRLPVYLFLLLQKTTTLIQPDSSDNPPSTSLHWCFLTDTWTFIQKPLKLWYKPSNFTPKHFITTKIPKPRNCNQ